MVVNRPPPVPKNVSSVNTLHGHKTQGWLFQASPWRGVAAHGQRHVEVRGRSGPSVDAQVVAAGLAGAIGGVGLTLALMRLRNTSPKTELEAPAPFKLTSSWRLSELQASTIVARDVEVEIPADATVIVAGQVEAQALASAKVLQVAAVAGEFALDATNSRALLFLGGVREGALALSSTDAALIQRLRAEATSLAQHGAPYFERRTVGQLAGRVGIEIETQGTVQDVLPYHGAFLLRLEDQGHALGVQLEKEPTELKGARVLVRGRLTKDKGGYPVLQASELRRIQ